MTTEIKVPGNVLRGDSEIWKEWIKAKGFTSDRETGLLKKGGQLWKLNKEEGKVVAVRKIGEATTTAAIPTYPMGGGIANSVKKQKKRGSKDLSFKDWLSLGANEYDGI